MKKILLATAAVALTAGAAAADGVSMSGYARFGIAHNSSWAKKTEITSRFRLNIAATKTTDSGVEFGAKFRLQSDQNTGGAPTSLGGLATNLMQSPNAATFWAKSGPFTLQVGNVADAIDNSGTYYNGDIGLLGTGDQEVIGGFIGYATGPYNLVTTPSTFGRVGVLATYAANGLTVNVSYITPDQTSSGNTDEKAISVDYTMGAFMIGAGYVKDPGFAAGTNASFISGQYAFGKSTVGLQVGDNPGARGNQYTLFGNTELSNGIGIQGYVTKDDDSTHGTGVGLGMSYDLGGAKLLGSIARTRSKNTIADFGVKFSF